MIFEYQAGEFRPLKTELHRGVRWLSWKKNGRAAVLVGDKGLVLSFDDGKFAKVDCPIHRNLRCSDYNPAKDLAVLVGNKGAFLTFESGELTVVSPATEANLRRVSWSPDGSSALIVGNAGTVLVWNGAHVREVGGATGNLRSIAWHPKGEYALLSGNYFAAGNVPCPTLYRYQMGASEAVPIGISEKTDLICVDWKPDGTFALAVGYEVVWQESRVFQWKNGELELLALQKHGMFPTAVAWQPDGKYALIGTGNPYPQGQGEGLILRYVENRFQQLFSSKYRVSCISWHPDGKYAWIVGAENARTFST